MPEHAPTRLADARQVRDLRDGTAGAFFTVWNGLVPDVWSVLIGVFEDEAIAIGWASTFRLALAARVSHFTLDEPLAVQVGRVLLSHVTPALSGSEGDEPPAGRAATPEQTLRTLPAAARLRYLVDLFFHVTAASDGPDGPTPGASTDLAVLHLMEPGLHTDARRTARSVLQRLPPDQVLFHPPGQVGRAADPRFGRVWKGLCGIVVLGFIAMGVVARPQRTDWASVADQCGLKAKEAGFTGGSDPEELSLALIRAGARVTLVEIPDLTAEGLNLIGGADAAMGTRGEAVLAFYASGIGAELAFYTLAHTAAQLPNDATNADGSLAEHPVGPMTLAGWVEPGGSWILCGLSGPGTARVAGQIRDRRREAVEAAGRAAD